jgi:plastocyanin
VRRRIGRIAIVVAVGGVLALGACGGAEDAPPADGGATEQPDGMAPEADVTISGFAFQPSTVRIEAGTAITIANQDGVAHTFTTSDGAIDEEIGGGETVEVEVPDDVEAGSFRCRFHSQMTGTLEVA